MTNGETRDRGWGKDRAGERKISRITFKKAPWRNARAKEYEEKEWTVAFGAKLDSREVRSRGRGGRSKCADGWGCAQKTLAYRDRGDRGLGLAPHDRTIVARAGGQSICQTKGEAVWGGKPRVGRGAALAAEKKARGAGERRGRGRKRWRKELGQRHGERAGRGTKDPWQRAKKEQERHGEERKDGPGKGSRLRGRREQWKGAGVRGCAASTPEQSRAGSFPGG